jgi:glycosyltransferase involved in cell wall biosynthesis
MGTAFQKELKGQIEAFSENSRFKHPSDELLKIDMHCHDHNSDVPDEILGRILNVPETWLKTKDLVKTLQENDCEVITITNHNNARSCYRLQEKGYDVLVAAEFTCTVPEFNISIHVLTYGFDEKQEIVLNKLRGNLYDFLHYAKKNNIPTIWAHPLYYYSPDGIPPMDFFDKLALVFERFEVINGQRDTWQNILVKEWIESLTPEKLDADAEKFGIDISRFCSDPYKKHFSGGSDSHMGIFAGETCTYLHIPNLKERRKNESLSSLALEAIREGRMNPYGSHQNSEKLTIAFLEFVLQIALNKKDPGLFRILLHKGTTQDKILALLISNAFAELKRHGITMNFIELLHKAFKGKVPGKMQRWFIPKDYKPVFDEAINIAERKDHHKMELVDIFSKSIDAMSQQINKILYSRLDEKVKELETSYSGTDFSLNSIIDNFEISSELRSYIGKKKKKKSKKGHQTPDLAKFLDGLSFPFLASSLILAANFTSAKVLYNNRPLLESFADRLGKVKHPERMMWLTDTFDDKNGVSVVLQSMLKVIQQKDLPIDLVVCSETLESQDHLVVIKPQGRYKLPMYEGQAITIPNFLDIHNLFLEGEYDRVISSTEGPMGMAALYLKHAYSVKSYFYVHTDWIMFANKVLNMDPSNISRFRRLLRGFYSEFDKVFVLNTDQQKWLNSREMGLAEDQVALTAHWSEEMFHQRKDSRKERFGYTQDDNIVLFAGRVSHEKGVMELVDVHKKLNNIIPNLKIVVAGTGPAMSELQEALPEANYLGWVNHEELPEIYSSADLLVLPSKFDTFSCVVLESISCGLPVISYKTKGPKDIIEGQDCGFVVNNVEEMIHSIERYFTEEGLSESLKKGSIERSKYYSMERIMKQFIEDVDLA